MTHDRRVVHSAFVGIAILLTAAAVSCGKPDTESPAAAVVFPDTLTAQDSAALEGELNLKGGQWHDAPCTGCQAVGEVQIRSVGKTVDIKANDGPPLRLVAQIKNTSAEDVTHGPSQFVFKAHKTYLVFVSRATAPSTNAQWGMTVFGIGYNPTAVIGALQDCGDPPTSPKIDDAGFYDCGERHASAKRLSLVKEAYAGERLPLAASIPKRVWISCDPDCCTGAGTYSGPAL